MRYEVIGIGSSWGGLNALGSILAALPPELEVPVVIAQHQSPSFHGSLAAVLGSRAHLPVEEVSDKASMDPGHVYIAPADYHTLLDDHEFSLSTDQQVHFSRPSIDVLFESVADSFGPAAIGVILTGANRDGAEGLARIKDAGGYTIVEDPETASQAAMPQAAVEAARPHKIARLEDIPAILMSKVGHRPRQKAAR